MCDERGWALRGAGLAGLCAEANAGSWAAHLSEHSHCRIEGQWGAGVGRGGGFGNGSKSSGAQRRKKWVDQWGVGGVFRAE